MIVKPQQLVLIVCSLALFTVSELHAQDSPVTEQIQAFEQRWDDTALQHPPQISESSERSQTSSNSATVYSTKSQVGVIAGRVVEAASGQPLSGATVALSGTARGTATDAFGRFSLTNVPAGSATLEASFIGFFAEEQIVTVEDSVTTTVNFSLAENTTELAEVVVRSEKFVRNLQETQASVGVVTGAEFEALKIRDWEDATLLVGNISTSGTGAFSIRGIPNTGLGSGSGPTAALYVDGVQQGQFTTSRTIRGTWDLDAIEVFRGPQSTLSGRNALAGAVYLRSARPSFDYGAAARLRAGEQGTLEGAFMVTGPIINDQLAFRVSGEVGGDDKALTYANIDSNLDGFDRTVTRLQRNLKNRLLFTPKSLPGLSILANYTYAYDRPIGFQGVTGVSDASGNFEFDDRISQSPNAFLDETTLHNSSLEISYDLSSALTLTSLTGSVFADYHIDGLSYQTDDPEAIVPIAQRSNTDEDGFTQELRLNYETVKTRAVFGGYYGNFKSDRTRNDMGDVWWLARPTLEATPVVQQLLQGEPLPRFGIIFESRSRDDRKNENFALFGEVNQEISDGITLTAGFRYDNETVQSRSFNEEIGGRFENAPPQLAAFEETVVGLIVAQVNTADTDVDTEFGVFLPKVGAVVDLNKDISIGATVQRGYRAGGVQVLTLGGINEFDPEFTWNYELSFRSRLADGRVTANANLFYTDWTDQQIAVPLAENPLFFRTENAGQSNLFGGEIELRAIPTSGLTLFSSLGLTQSEFDEFVLSGRDLAGFEFPGAPGTTFSVGAIYDQKSGLSGALNLSYLSEHFSQVGTIMEGNGSLSNDPLLRSGDYTIVDAQVGYSFNFQGNRVQLTAFTRNLFDKIALDSVTLDLVGRPVAQLRQPRVFGASIDIEL